MKKQNERMSTLETAGITTGQYFSLSLPTGLKPGSQIHVVISEDGNPIVMSAPETESETNYNEMVQQIIEDGYIANQKLYRRWVMAQMFRALNYKRYETKCYYTNKPYPHTETRSYCVASGYNDYVNTCYPYNYQFTMMKDELEQLNKLKFSDQAYYTERSHFFTPEVVIETCEDYVEKLRKYINGLPIKQLKNGRFYKTCYGRDVLEGDIEYKVYAPLLAHIRLMKSATSLSELRLIYLQFMRLMYPLPVDTPKAKIWKDAFKGAGAYYTCKNLILYHGCKIEGVKGITSVHMKHLEEKLHEYKGEGWRMFAFMKKLIADNNFDFDKRMKEIYKNK